MSSSRVILQTDRQTDRHRWQHNLLGGGKIAARPPNIYMYRHQTAQDVERRRGNVNGYSVGVD